MQDLSSPTRDGTYAPWTRWSLNHWTAREVPTRLFNLPFYLIIQQPCKRGIILHIFQRGKTAVQAVLGGGVGGAGVG